MNLFLVMFPLFLFLGCSSTKTVYRTEIEYVLVKPSQSLLEECSKIKTPELQTNKDLIMAYNDLLFEYFICSNKIVLLKEFYKNYETNLSVVENTANNQQIED